jgi:hypothetical protein
MRETPFHLASATAGPLFILMFMTACNFNDPPSSDSPEVAGEDLFHEKSFSWDAPTTAPGLTKVSARSTDFATTEAYVEAVRGLVPKLGDPTFTDAIWKPLDHACDELDLALWNVYGTIRVGDSTVFDEDMLRERCRPLGHDTSEGSLEKAAVNPSSEEEDRQYPYKMIGRSWSNANRIVYYSSGGETQFKKHREKLWTMAWWDTDASKIGVRAYYYDCGMVKRAGVWTRACVGRESRSDSDNNDDYVSERHITAGLSIDIQVYAYSAFNGQISGVESYAFKVFDGVIAMHSVNHGSHVFRAVSSSGMGDITIDLVQRDYVTW